MSDSHTGSAFEAELELRVQERTRELEEKIAVLNRELVERAGVEEELRVSRANFGRELEDARHLQKISSLLVEDEKGEGLYGEILDAAMAIMRADFASLQILDVERDELQLLGWKNFHPESAEYWQTISAQSGTSCGLSLQHGKRMIMPDVNAFVSEIGSGTMSHYDLNGIKAVQSTPLTTRDGRVIGMISTQWRERHEPGERALALFDVLARQAADVLERRRVHEALRSLNDELEDRVNERTSRVRQLLRQLISVQEEERRRIARELHDTLGQQLAALHWSIELVKSKNGNPANDGEEAKRMREIFDRLNSDVDFLAWQLRPAALDTLGFNEALETFVGEWSEHFGVKTAYSGLANGDLRLSPEVETNLYRVLQEALQNIHKHSEATYVSVILERRDHKLILIVEDNGKGYEVAEESVSDGIKGMGLANMRERAELFGGELEIESAPGKGTTIFARIPIE